MNGSARLSLPFLSAGQAQKELVHNEALQILDIVVAANVAELARNDPPTSPGIGGCYIVGASPSGEWAGKIGQIAAMTGGGWRFVPPIEGMTVVVKPSGMSATFRGGSWEVGMIRASILQIDGKNVVSARQPAIPDPAGGTTNDSQSRTTIAQILTALRQHGLIAE